MNLQKNLSVCIIILSVVVLGACTAEQQYEPTGGFGARKEFLNF